MPVDSLLTCSGNGVLVFLPVANTISVFILQCLRTTYIRLHASIFTSPIIPPPDGFISPTQNPSPLQYQTLQYIDHDQASSQHQRRQSLPNKGLSNPTLPPPSPCNLHSSAITPWLPLTPTPWLLEPKKNIPMYNCKWLGPNPAASTSNYNPPPTLLYQFSTIHYSGTTPEPQNTVLVL